MKVITPDARPRVKTEAGGSSSPAGSATIGAFLRFGRGLVATCPVCLHAAELDLSDLAARLGADHACSETALQAKLQCSVCKSTEAILEETRSAQGRIVPLRATARASASV